MTRALTLTFVVGALVGSRGGHRFQIDLAHKDLGLALTSASSMKVPLAMGAAARECLQLARSRGTSVRGTGREADPATFWDRDAEDLLPGLLLAAAAAEAPISRVGTWLTAVSSVEPRNHLVRAGFTQLGLPAGYNGRIRVRVLGGSGRVSAYASVIDSRTEDPTYIPAQ